MDSDAELYTLDEDGTLQQVVVEKEDPDTDAVHSSIEVLYLDTEENSLTTIGGQELVVKERDGQMVLVREDEIDPSLNEAVFKPVGNKS